MDFKKLTPPQQLCNIMSRIYEAGLTTPSGGNLSLRDKDGNIWVTPSGGDKGRYKEEDILKILPDGRLQGKGRPSVETEIHRGILKARSEFNAVVHAHPPNMVAISLLRDIPQVRILPRVFNGVKDISVAAYGCPGSELLKENVVEVFEDGVLNVAVLENHGAFVASKNGIRDGFGLFQDIDHSIGLQARATVFAEGRINLLTDEQLKEYNEAGRQECNGLEHFEEDKNKQLDAKEKSVRQEICSFMSRGYKRGLFTQNHGVISARLKDNSFIITEHNGDNADLMEDEPVKIAEGKAEKGKVPSQSFRLHQKIYEENPQIEAIIMGCPTNAMVFAVTDYNYDLKTIPECYIVLREEISKFPFGSVFSGREKLSKYFREKAPVAIVENDCFICTGTSIFNAFDKLEVLEFSAEAVVNAKLLGGDVQKISEVQAQEIKDKFR